MTGGLVLALLTKPSILNQHVHLSAMSTGDGAHSVIAAERNGEFCETVGSTTSYS